jgi:hypothetical protein
MYQFIQHTYCIQNYINFASAEHLIFYGPTACLNRKRKKADLSTVSVSFLRGLYVLLYM